MNKKVLSESDICDKFIRPAMESAGWDRLGPDLPRVPVAGGCRVVVRGRKARRDASTVLRADYALFYKLNIPLAVIEAKDDNHAMGAGMAQAINYGQLLDVPFSFSSNGDGFVFRDATLADGVLERNLTLTEFPSPAELWARYCAWKGWSPEVRKVAESDYAPSKTPRYYQLTAINRTVEAIAGGQNRVLLVMATGTGKTYAGRRNAQRKPSAELVDGEVPFEVPARWEWKPLGEIGIVGSSSRVHQTDWTTSGVPFYRAREVVKLSKYGRVENELFSSEELFVSLSRKGLVPAQGDVMLTGVGTIGVPYAVQEYDRFYFKDASVLIFKNCYSLNARFLCFCFLSPYWIQRIHENSMGTTVDTLTISRAAAVPIPVPPLAEQARIVARVEELMRLCDALEANGKLEAAQRAQLLSTCWARSPTAPRPRSWPPTGNASPITSTSCSTAPRPWTRWSRPSCNWPCADFWCRRIRPTSRRACYWRGFVLRRIG